MKFVTKLAQKFCQDSSFPIHLMVMKILINETDRNLDRAASIVFMIIVCLSFMIYWYLLYSSLMR